MRYTIWAQEHTGEWYDCAEDLSEREAVKVVRDMKNLGISAKMVSLKAELSSNARSDQSGTAA